MVWIWQTVPCPANIHVIYFAAEAALGIKFRERIEGAKLVKDKGTDYFKVYNVSHAFS